MIMKNNIGILAVISYVFLLPLLIIGEVASLFFENETYSIICSIGCTACLLGIGLLNRQYKSLFVFTAIMFAFVVVSAKFNITIWVAFGWATLAYSVLSYLNIIIYWIKKMNNILYKACTVCFLLIFCAYVYVEYLNALNKRFYLLDKVGSIMYDNWTGGVYVIQDGKMYYFDIAKGREKAIYKEAVSGSDK